MKTDNELIAEFMGWSLDGCEYENRMAHSKSPTQSAVLIKNLQYNTSWDWLMPVVKKIRLLLENNELYEKSKVRNFWPVIMLSFEAVAIEATYIPVVEFIKWYNTQKH